jgi:hypothetical protein
MSANIRMAHFKVYSIFEQGVVEPELIADLPSALDECWLKLSQGDLRVMIIIMLFRLSTKRAFRKLYGTPKEQTKP